MLKMSRDTWVNPLTPHVLFGDAVATPLPKSVTYYFNDPLPNIYSNVLQLKKNLKQVHSESFWAFIDEEISWWSKNQSKEKIIFFSR